MRAPRSQRLFAAGIALVTLWSFPYLEKTHNANELPRIYLTQAVVERHALDIDEGVRRYGWVVDTASYGGHTYSNKAPGLSLVGVPVYAGQRLVWKALGLGPPSLRAQTLALRLCCVTLPNLLFLFVLWQLLALGTTDLAARRIALAAYALGTLALPFGLLFISHQGATALVATAFALFAGEAGRQSLVRTDHLGGLVRSARLDSFGARSGRLFLGGLCAAAAVLFDYQAAFFLLPLAVYALVRVRPLLRLGFAILGAAGPAVALGAYHKACFGGVLRTGYAYATVPQFRAIHHQGLLGLTRPSWVNFFESFLSPASGLFALSPWLLLGLCGLGLALRRRRHRAEMVLCGAMIVTGMGFLTALLFARGGWGMGPRYFAIAIPFLVLPAAAALERALPRGGLAPLAAALCCASVFLYVGSALILPLWPDKLRNPVCELAWPLLRDGFSPYNLGRLAGLPARSSLWPAYAVALVVTVAPWHGWLARVGGVVIGGALLTLFTFAPRTVGPDATGVARWIESIWEPAPASPPSTPVAPVGPPGPVAAPARPPSAPASPRSAPPPVWPPLRPTPGPPALSPALPKKGPARPGPARTPARARTPASAR